MGVHKTKRKSCKQKRTAKGSGFVNKLIDKLPVELHIPGYAEIVFH